MDYYADLGIEIDGFAKGGMPAKNKKNFRSTKSGAGMTAAGVRAYRRMNPGSKLKTAVTGKVKKGSKAAKRRASYCRRSKEMLDQTSRTSQLERKANESDNLKRITTEVPMTIYIG